MTVILGIMKSVDDSQVTEVAQFLRLGSGVASVRSASGRPRLLLLDYDENLTSRVEILSRLGKRGWHAKVAGC